MLGAVYNPIGETVPVVEFPPTMLLTVQLTCELNAPVPVTMALNCWACPVVRLAEVGEIEIPEIDGVGDIDVPPLPPPQPVEMTNGMSRKNRNATISERRKRMGIVT